MVLLLSFSIKADSIGANVPLTTGEWVYFALEKLETNGLTGPMFANSKPFGREEIARIVADMRKGIEEGRLRPNRLELGLVEKLEAEFVNQIPPNPPLVKGGIELPLVKGGTRLPLVKGETGRPLAKGGAKLEARGLLSGEGDYDDDWGPGSLSLWSGASFRPTPGVTLYEEIDVGRGRDLIGEEGETASRRTNRWKWDYTADFRRAYVSYRRGRFEALFGRQSLFWGPGYGGSLILSDNSPAFDMLLLSARFGPVKAMAFSAMLDKMWGEHGDPPYRYLANRYLSGHRVDWMVNDRIELGLSELVLYGGDVRGIELQYINPLLPYYATQWNSATDRRDDNVMACAEFAVRPVDGLKVYGQFLVDDFSYSGGDPNALGYIAGFYLSDPLGLSGTDLRAEYTRVDSWTYTHLEQDKQFTHYGWLIGHELGPDADQLLLEPSMMVKLDGRVKLVYAFEREGSRTVADRFRGEDYRRMEFPSGKVERRHKLGIKFLWEPLYGPRVNISWQHSFVRDKHDTDDLNIMVGFLYGVKRGI